MAHFTWSRGESWEVSTGTFARVDSFAKCLVIAPFLGGITKHSSANKWNNLKQSRIFYCNLARREYRTYNNSIVPSTFPISPTAWNGRSFKKVPPEFVKGNLWSFLFYLSSHSLIEYIRWSLCIGYNNVYRIRLSDLTCNEFRLHNFHIHSSVCICAEEKIKRHIL